MTGRKSRFFSGSLFIIFMVMIISTVSAVAAIINVPGDHPTIQAAIDASLYGDVVLVAPGEYLERLTLKAGVYLAGSGAKLTKIFVSGNLAPPYNTSPVVNADSASTIDGFTITGGYIGVSVFSQSYDVKIVNNIITNNGFGISTKYRCSQIIADNVIKENTIRGIYLYQLNNSTITNNTIVGPGDQGITVYMSNVRLTNNIVTGLNKGVTNWLDSSSVILLSCNNVWGNSSNYVYLSDQTGMNGNISEDPKFTDDINGDFSLQPDSPCIDIGDNGAPGLPVFDLNGNPRIINDVVDMGAFEYQVGSIEASIDIDPDTLNLKSKGKWITAYIELPEGYDVVDIDVSTLLLNDSVQAEERPNSIGDYDDDGILDLMVKFNRDAVISLLEVGDEVEITISGELNDGPQFEDKDIIRVINKGK